MSCVPRKRAKWHVKNFISQRLHPFTFNICYISSASIVPVHAIFYWLRLFLSGPGLSLLNVAFCYITAYVFCIYLSLKLLSSWVEYSLLWNPLDAILTRLNVAKYKTENCMLSYCVRLKGHTYWKYCGILQDLNSLFWMMPGCVRLKCSRNQ